MSSGNSPTPGTPTIQSPNQTSDSEDLPQESAPYNPPQINEENEQNQVSVSPYLFDQSQELHRPIQMGQDHIEENKTLFISNIPLDATEEQLREHFSKVAVAQNVRIFLRPDGTSKCKALCDFSTVEDAKKIQQEFHQANFNGRTLQIQFSVPNRRPSSQHYNRRPHRRFNTTYRDLDAPDDDDEPKRSYDLEPDEQIEPKRKETRGFRDNRNNYGRGGSHYGGRRSFGGHRSYDRDMGRVQDYRTQRPFPPQGDVIPPPAPPPV